MLSNGFQLGGEIKVYPEDFVVEETWGDRLCTVGLEELATETMLGRQSGEYLHFTLVKKDWTTVKALQYLADRLHVSLKRFGFSGMKDKRALTSQRISGWHIQCERLMRVHIRDVWVKDLEYSMDRITLGNASGNMFTVTIRNIPRNAVETSRILEDFESSIREGRRIPNFYGHQRLEGGNVDIGRAIVNGNLRLAVETILQKINAYRGGKVEDIPDAFWIEKLVLQYLRNNENDYAGALRRIPKKILRIFTHAVQSQSFNDALRKAIQEGEVPETLEVEGFPVPRMPELGTQRIQRTTYLDAKCLSVLRVEDGLAKISFALGRGEYATTLLSFLGVDVGEDKYSRTD